MLDARELLNVQFNWWVFHRLRKSDISVIQVILFRLTLRVRLSRCGHTKHGFFYQEIDFLRILMVRDGSKDALEAR